MVKVSPAKPVELTVLVSCSWTLYQLLWVKGIVMRDYHQRLKFKLY